MRWWTRRLWLTRLNSICSEAIAATMGSVEATMLLEVLHINEQTKPLAQDHQILEHFAREYKEQIS